MLVHLGPVVRKLIGTNPGLKVNQGFYLDSCFKMFSKTSFKLEVKMSQKSKLKAKKSLEKVLFISYLTGFKVDANHGLA